MKNMEETQVELWNDMKNKEQTQVLEVEGVLVVVEVVVVVANCCKKCNDWNKWCNYENKMAGKGQITSERDSS